MRGAEFADFTGKPAHDDEDQFFARVKQGFQFDGLVFEIREFELQEVGRGERSRSDLVSELDHVGGDPVVSGSSLLLIDDNRDFVFLLRFLTAHERDDDQGETKKYESGAESGVDGSKSF